MRTLRGRLILSHILPLLLVIPVVGLGLIYLLETQVLLTNLSEQLTDEAYLIAQAINQNPDIWTDEEGAQALTAGANVYVEGRVFLLKPNGEILAQSGEGGLEIDAAIIQKALQGEESVVVAYGLFTQSAEVLIPVKDINKQIVGVVGVSQKLEGLATQFLRLRWWVLGILGLELILGGIIGYLLARRLSKPIDTVASSVIDIAKGETIDPVPEGGPQELRQLAVSVNILNERLRLLEETRRRSLANIVHELGRPLGAIQAAIHALQGGAAEDPTLRVELLEGMQSEIGRMEPLLDDLALLHGQVEGIIELSLQPVILSDWLPPVLLPWRAVAKESGLDWQVTVSENLPTLKFDPDRMAQAVGNLLSNAIKYTPQGGQVSVSAGSKGSEAWIMVKDSGPGIIPEERERIFEPFYRSTEERRFPQGLGIGLTIAQELVHAHGGYMELKSTPGEGSQFTIYLPIKENNRIYA
jgi:signal transduction histidine kinase